MAPKKKGKKQPVSVLQKEANKAIKRARYFKELAPEYDDSLMPKAEAVELITRAGEAYQTAVGAAEENAFAAETHKERSDRFKALIKQSIEGTVAGRVAAKAELVRLAKQETPKRGHKRTRSLGEDDKEPVIVEVAPAKKGRGRPRKEEVFGAELLDEERRLLEEIELRKADAKKTHKQLKEKERAEGIAAKKVAIKAAKQKEFDDMQAAIDEVRRRKNTPDHAASSTSYALVDIPITGPRSPKTPSKLSGDNIMSEEYEPESFMSPSPAYMSRAMAKREKAKFRRATPGAVRSRIPTDAEGVVLSDWRGGKEAEWQKALYPKTTKIALERLSPAARSMAEASPGVVVDEDGKIRIIRKSQKRIDNLLKGSPLK